MKNKFNTVYGGLKSVLKFAVNIRVIAFVLLVFSCLLIMIDPAFARAGGGDGFSGGGGGINGGSSGDGGGLFFLIYLAFRYPAIGVPLLIIVAIFMFYSSKNVKNKRMERTINRGYSVQQDRVYEESLKYLKDKDPDFEELPLIDKAKSVFIKLQEAWSNQNMKPVRCFVSDGIYERFTQQLDIQKKSLIKNITKNINIINTKLIAVESDHYFDTVHIMITASAIDYYVRSDNGKQVGGNIMEAQPFTEYWSFLRRPGTKTLSEKGLFEGFCPNCGTPLELSDSIICSSCKAVINSGEYDWVLAEITQASEWKIRPSKMIAGMDKICAKDPAFNMQHIEDKVSVMFYRNIASQFFADTKYISKLATKEFLEENKSRYIALENGKHQFYADAAVGTVEVVEVILGQDEDSMDTIRVRVKWTGHKMDAKVPSFMPPDFASSHIFTQEYILNRKSSVLTSTKNTLTSLHCPGCGAPESFDNSGNCSYCGIPLNDGSVDWVLVKIQVFSGYPAISHYEAFQHAPMQMEGVPVLSQFDNESIISCAVAIMLSDGEIDEKEQSLLEQMAYSKGVSQQKLSMIIKTVQERGLDIPCPKSTEAAKEFLRCMVRMCLADGKISSSEQVMLRNLVSKMGYSDIDVKMMINKERNKLYSHAKSVIQN